MFHEPPLITTEDIYLHRITKLNNDCLISNSVIIETENKAGSLMDRNPIYKYTTSFIGSYFSNVPYLAFKGIVRTPVKIECSLSNDDNPILRKKQPSFLSRLENSKNYVIDKLASKAFTSTLWTIFNYTVDKYISNQILARSISTFPLIQQNKMQGLMTMITGPLTSLAISELTNQIATAGNKISTVYTVGKNVISEIEKDLKEIYEVKQNK